ncbi:MAG TPA: glycosyltransferase [Pyrinomonadaceae bacterium]|nr:glycosyltransferase [Pyrinomonadaceae bacterium]
MKHAAGIPYVAAPVGAIKEIGEAGRTHLCATAHDEWLEALATLVSDPEKRKWMGKEGRLHVTRHYNLALQADKLAQALREAI